MQIDALAQCIQACHQAMSGRLRVEAMWGGGRASESVQDNISMTRECLLQAVRRDLLLVLCCQWHRLRR